jgi:amidase
MDNLIYASATQLARAIQSKQVSSTEVVTSYVRRIEAVNPSLNAVVQLTADTALDQARAADASLARGQFHGPLHGVPMTIKDSFDTAGVISTGGTLGRAAYVPTQDATAVARLRAAGAILLGKTNTPDLTLAGTTENLVYGRTNHPCDPALTPGGSSGGSAAILAAGGSPVDLGSDTGGSIRIPSHFCGTAGIKPTSGRVPRTGHIISFDMGALDNLTQPGPMARFVEDLILTLPILAGVDWCDPAIVPAPLADPRLVNLKGLRLSVYVDNGVSAPSPETAEVIRSTAQCLAEAGVVIVEDRPPGVERAPDLWFELFRADGGARIRSLLQKAGTQEVSPYLQWTQSGTALSLPEYVELLTRWDRFRSELLAYLWQYDAILCPTCAHIAVPHGTPEAPARIDFSYTMAYNLTGWPSVVVRAGTSPQGLPIGVQVVARPWREDVALAMAQHIETALGGWQPPP